jgi:chemotaxis family two-component system response regulator Rcp1
MRPVRLFVAEDNEADIQWLRKVLDGMGFVYDLSVVTDGEQAVDFLLKRGEYAGAPDPDFIILDLNLPKVKGIDVLRSVPHSEQLPVCIVTGSAEDREILKTKFGIRRISYLIKPVDRDRILNSFRCYDRLRPLAEELASAVPIRH